MEQLEDENNYNEMKKTWKEEVQQNALESTFDQTCRYILHDLFDLEVGEFIRRRNQSLAEEMARDLSSKMAEQVIAEEMRRLAGSALEEARVARAARMREVRERRQARLVRQAAVWWLRQTRQAVRRRQARQVMPKLAKENLLAKIGANSFEWKSRGKRRFLGEIFDSSRDQLAKSWKEKRRSAEKKREVATYDVHAMLDSLRGTNGMIRDASRLIASVFVHYPPELEDFAKKKFGDSNLTKRLKIYTKLTTQL